MTGFATGMVAGALWLVFFIGLGLTARRSPGHSSKSVARFRSSGQRIPVDVPSTLGPERDAFRTPARSADAAKDPRQLSKGAAIGAPTVKAGGKKATKADKVAKADKEKAQAKPAPAQSPVPAIAAKSGPKRGMLASMMGSKGNPKNPESAPPITIGPAGSPAPAPAGARLNIFAGGKKKPEPAPTFTPSVASRPVPPPRPRFSAPYNYPAPGSPQVTHQAAAPPKPAWTPTVKAPANMNPYYRQAQQPEDPKSTPYWQQRLEGIPPKSQPAVPINSWLSNRSPAPEPEPSQPHPIVAAVPPPEPWLPELRPQPAARQQDQTEEQDAQPQAGPPPGNRWITEPSNHYSDSRWINFDDLDRDTDDDPEHEQDDAVAEEPDWDFGHAPLKQEVAPPLRRRRRRGGEPEPSQAREIPTVRVIPPAPIRPLRAAGFDPEPEDHAPARVRPPRSDRPERIQPVHTPEESRIGVSRNATLVEDGLVYVMVDDEGRPVLG